MLKISDAIALVLYCLFIYLLSDQPSLPVPMMFPHQDKIYHAAAYFIMGVLAIRTFSHSYANHWSIALAFCSFYGITDEWHQSFVAGRSSELADWLADCSGSCLSALWLRKFPCFGNLR
ncbi:MAG: VanZ family protein [Gammaproteobacteria bacterium]